MIRKLHILLLVAAIGHVHNVVDPSLPESQTVNSRMMEFMLNQL
jgi:hypothetical protein